MRADWIILMIAAARLPLRSDPANNQWTCPYQTGHQLPVKLMLPLSA